MSKCKKCGDEFYNGGVPERVCPDCIPKEKLSDDWKNTSISVGTTRATDIVHTLESTFPDVPEAEGLGDLIYSFWEADNKEERGHRLNKDIWNFLNEIAPEGCYFGAHPNDNSDYGFWDGDGGCRCDDLGSCEHEGGV